MVITFIVRGRDNTLRQKKAQIDYQINYLTLSHKVVSSTSRHGQESNGPYLVVIVNISHDGPLNKITVIKSY